MSACHQTLAIAPVVVLGEGERGRVEGEGEGQTKGKNTTAAAPGTKECLKYTHYCVRLRALLLSACFSIYLQLLGFCFPV